MKKITWITPEDEERTGTFWSPGSTETSIWVIPDERREGEAYAVQVGKDGRQNRNHVRRSQQSYQDKVRAALVNRKVVPGLRCKTLWGIEEVPMYLAPHGGHASLGPRVHTLDLCRE